MDWWWWLKNLLHIESLFFIMLIIFFLYFLFGGKHRRYYLNQLKDIADTKWSGKTVNHSNKKVNKGEEKCRTIFEGYFGLKFESIRPDWLKYPETNRNLELDGFNPSVKTKLGKGLAFEYDGAQHAYYTPAFHKNEGEFKNQVKRDIWKDRKCKELGILLIRIPHTVHYDHLASHILSKLRSVGL